MDLRLYLFCLSFCLLYFSLPPFENNGLLFWVPDVLCQHSEGVLWNLFSVKCSFDEFVGEKVVSPSYSSAILGPPLMFLSYFDNFYVKFLILFICYFTNFIEFSFCVFFIAY